MTPVFHRLCDRSHVRCLTGAKPRPPGHLMHCCGATVLQSPMAVLAVLPRYDGLARRVRLGQEPALLRREGSCLRRLRVAASMRTQMVSAGMGALQVLRGHGAFIT